MNCRRKNRIEKVQYASMEDFRRLFTEEMNSLYRLALLLTADHEKAEQCFVAGLEDSTQANRVFRSWARSWAKRTIVQNAIHVLHPHEGATSTARAPIHDGISRSMSDFGLGPVLALEDFERFVFVMSVLERYSDRECALLLGCLVQDIHEARSQAFQHMTTYLALDSLPHARA